MDDDPDYTLLLKRVLTKTLKAFVEQEILDRYHIDSQLEAQEVLPALFSAGHVCNSSRRNYDLVLMDTNLGIDRGYTVCAEIMAYCDTLHVPRAPVVGMSSILSEANVEEWKKAGAFGFYHKDMLINLSGAGLQPVRYMLPGKTVLEGLLLRHISNTTTGERGFTSSPSMYSSSGGSLSEIVQ